VTDAPDKRTGRLARQYLVHVVTVEPRLGDDGARQPLTRGQLRDPARLAERIRRVPLRLHVDRTDDPMILRVGPVVCGQVVASERPRVTVAEGRGRLIPEPGVLAEPEVPEVLVGVDDGYVVGPR
jgi:hypothetical protein